jgi:hypothetical protein
MHLFKDWKNGKHSIYYASQLNQYALTLGVITTFQFMVQEAADATIP